MAGSYPDAPSRRIAWDDDGTVAYGVAAASGGPTSLVRGDPPGNLTLVELTTQKASMNDDSDAQYGVAGSAGQYPAVWVYLFFPQKMEVDGYYWNIRSTDTPNPAHFLSISTNTTNGIDGTYSALGSEVNTGFNQTAKPDYRQNIQTTVESNVLSVLSQAGGTFTGINTPTWAVRSLHLYGTVTPGETPDRILFLDTLASDAEFAEPLDYGNIGRGTTNIRTIKVKNNSGSLTANTVQITAEEITGSGGSLFTFSTDGIADSGTKALGNIGPGGTVLVYVHLTVPDAQALDLYDARFSVNVASWA